MNAKSAAGLSPKTVRHIRGVLATALARALKWGLVHRNAAALAVRRGRSAIRFAPSPQMKRAPLSMPLQASGTSRSICSQSRSACGVAKCWGLNGQDVDFDARTVHVRGALQRVGGKLTLSETKTERSRRTLPLLDFVAKALRTHRTRQLQERLMAGSAWHDTGFVFTTRIGTPVDPANLLDDFRRVLVKAKSCHTSDSTT